MNYQEAIELLQCNRDSLTTVERDTIESIKRSNFTLLQKQQAIIKVAKAMQYRIAKAGFDQELESLLW